MLSIPLQFIDAFLLKLNLGDVLLVGFVLGTLAVLPMRSRKLLTLHFIAFGALFMILPGGFYESAELSLFPEILHYKLVGLALLIVAPVLYTTADR